MTAATLPAQAGERGRRWDELPVVRALAARPAVVLSVVGVAILSITRIVTDNNDITSSSLFGVALRTAMPIAMAGLAGLYAERSGTVNIGLEGMMVMGTIFAGWWGWYFDVKMAMLGGLIGGLLGGLLHALATTTFGVNHIVSGFAINILAPGVARFMANELFTGQPGGSVTSSPGNEGDIERFTMPFLSGGDLFGWKSPDALGRLERQHWFFVSDVAGLLRGLTANLTIDVIIGGALIVVAWYVLWHTPFGLRLRSAGEKPSAPDSLGVSVARMRYAGMAISGAMAGFGGAILVIFSNRYQENQTGGRGFLGLATLISGNWRPSGLAAFSGVFGYASGVTVRRNPEALVRDLLLAFAIALALGVIVVAITRSWIALGALAVISIAGFWAYAEFQRPNNQFVYIFPYVVTLVVVSVRGGNLRPPAAAGIPYFKGQQS